MKCVWWAVAVGAVAALAGCGPTYPTGTPLKGTLTYEGNPVAYGLINIAPDTMKGNKGVFGVAEVRDGEYQTSPDYAPTLGPVIVSVQVYDSPPPNNKMIANIMEYPVEIPPGSASWDFKMTAKHVKTIKQ
ncbi:MAG: hypothetical protein C0467_27040 [Planctomycetaceae bacterium]|nr:hypothetical protein [Planctomycetaceae bacterium]